MTDGHIMISEFFSYVNPLLLSENIFLINKKPDILKYPVFLMYYYK